MEFDIRKPKEDEITKIRFADNYTDGFRGAVQIKRIEGGRNYIALQDEAGREAISRAKDVPNLILALQKAVELGWTK